MPEATWIEFNAFSAAVTFDRYPAWNFINHYIDPISCISYGYSIVHEQQLRKIYEKCSDEPPWKP